MLWPFAGGGTVQAATRGRPMPLPAPVPQRPAAARLAIFAKLSAVETLAQSMTMPEMTTLPL